MLTLHIDTDTYKQMVKDRGYDWLTLFDVRVYLAPGIGQEYWLSGTLFSGLIAA